MQESPSKNEFPVKVRRSGWSRGQTNNSWVFKQELINEDNCAQTGEKWGAWSAGPSSGWGARGDLGSDVRKERKLL